jgi:hypothetical protein
MHKSLLIKSLGSIAVAIAVALLVGCGGGSSSGATTTVTTSSHTKAEYIKLANALCKRGKEALLGEISAYMKTHNGPNTDAKKVFVAAVQADLLPAVQKQAEELRKLGAPQGDEKRIEALLAALESAATAHRTGPVPPEEVFIKDFERSAKLASEYGLENCSYEG